MNVLSPGMVRTEMTEKAFSRLTAEQIRHLEDSHPLGFGSPEDVAHAAAFLLSPESRWITATDLVVDGGCSAQQREENVMTQQEALEWIARLFEEKPERLTPDTVRDDIRAWDSLGVLTLMADLDSDFSILLSDDEVQGMKTVNDILEILRKHGKLT